MKKLPNAGADVDGSTTYSDLRLDGTLNACLLDKFKPNALDLDETIFVK